MNTLTFSLDAAGIGRLTLNRAAQYNAIDLEMIDELTAFAQAIDPACRVLLVSGHGKHFCSGADIHWMKRSATLSAEENTADALAFSTMLRSLNELPCPVIARVQGAALGGAVGLLACCDIVVASQGAQFGLTEVRLGLIPATISPYVIPAIGARAARRYFLTGERFDAATAHRMGLVHELASDDTLDDAVETIVADLLRSGPVAQAAAKTLIPRVSGHSADDALISDVTARLARLRTGEEAQEGFAAFLEKRRPAWVTD